MVVTISRPAACHRQIRPHSQPTVAPIGMTNAVMYAGEKTSAIAAVDPRGQRKTDARMPRSAARALVPAPSTSHGFCSWRPTNHRTA